MLSQSGCLLMCAEADNRRDCVIPVDTRHKEKKIAKTRSKVKSSDEDGSPKSAQKKVKLLQTYVYFELLSFAILSHLALQASFFCGRAIRGEFNSPSANFGNVHPSDVLDMPVDPNEPTYCLCHQVSYGEMIGCDNTDVSRLLFQPQDPQILRTSRVVCGCVVKAKCAVYARGEKKKS